jgi:hypothetical protein
MMADIPTESEEQQNRIIVEIVELQRSYYFENKNRDTERRRALRGIIERATPTAGGKSVA